MEREEHLQWAKDRAKDHKIGVYAWSSFVSDLGKHEELKDHIAIMLGNLTLAPNVFEINETIKFIEGFN